MHMCTCVRARTHTHRRKRKCPTVARWHPTAVKQTADQTRVLEKLDQLVGAADWRGVAAQERAARAVAADFHAEQGCVDLQHPRQSV